MFYWLKWISHSHSTTAILWCSNLFTTKLFIGSYCWPIIGQWIHTMLVFRWHILFLQEPELTHSRASSVLLGPEGEALSHSKPVVANQKEILRGYDCKFVTPPPPAFQTECPICLLILREPYQATCCGKSFCHSCIQGIENKSHCPACSETLQLYSNVGLRQSLIQLLVWCTHREDGCKWFGELGQLECHLNEANHSGEYSWASSMRMF